MELIFEPSVRLIAQTQLNHFEIEAWAKDLGFEDIYNDSDSALSRCLQQMPADALPEFAGRFCYRSFKSGRATKEYLTNILESGHGSVFEHVQFTFALAGISRTLTHELVRHRIGIAISQESQRYVDAKDINFVVPPLLVDAVMNSHQTRDEFESYCAAAVENYLLWQERTRILAEKAGFDSTMARKRANEAARWCLPGAAETRMVWSCNMRALRHMLYLRGAEAADLEINRLAKLIAVIVIGRAPYSLCDATRHAKGVRLGFGSV